MPYKQAKREVIFEPACSKEPIPKENPTLLCPLTYQMHCYVPVQSCVPIQSYVPMQYYDYAPMLNCCIPMQSYEPMQNYVQTTICFLL